MARYALRYEKGEGARWLSHLDVLRTFERALRRSELPVAYTEGFNPRPKLWFAAPIGVGVTGEAEMSAFDLTLPVNSEDIAERLAAVMPQAFPVRGAWPIPQMGSPFGANVVNRMRIMLEPPVGVTAENLQNAIDVLMAQTEIEIERESKNSLKKINIRPRIARLELEQVADRAATMLADLVQTNEFGVRPNELAESLARVLPGVGMLGAHRIEVRESKDTQSSKKGGDTVCPKR